MLPIVRGTATRTIRRADNHRADVLEKARQQRLARLPYGFRFETPETETEQFARANDEVVLRGIHHRCQVQVARVFLE